MYNGLETTRTRSEELRAMTLTQLRQTAKQSLDGLPAGQLKAAAEFIRFLEERASDEATEELLKIPGLLEDLEEAERDIAAGGGISWREVRQDV